MIRNTIRKDYMSKDDVYGELLSIKNYLDTKTNFYFYESSLDELVSNLNNLNNLRFHLNKKDFSEEELQFYYDIEDRLNERLKEFEQYDMEREMYEYH
jgi:hypothetical protein